MFGSKLCHVRVAMDAARDITLFWPFWVSTLETIFDEWAMAYARVFIDIHFLKRFQINAFSVNIRCR